MRTIFDNYICIHSNDTLTKDKHMKAFLSLSNGGLIMLIAFILIILVVLEWIYVVRLFSYLTFAMLLFAFVLWHVPNDVSISGTCILDCPLGFLWIVHS